MPERQTHIIHTLKYDIHFQNAEANGQEESISNLHHEYFAGFLEELFDKYAPEGKYLTGDTIEIDLGLIPKNEFPDAFKTKINTFFEEKIMLAGKQVSEEEGRSQTDIPEQEDDLKILSSGEHKVWMLLHFLRKGYFNWRYSSSSDTNPNVLFKEALQKYPDHLEPMISTLLQLRVKVLMVLFLMLRYRC